MDFRPHDRRALELAGAVIESVSPADLELPTPCPPWSLADLLRHMISQNKRFAAVARGEDADAAAPLEGSPLGAAPAAEYWASADLVTAAFTAPGTMERQVDLAELAGPPLPAPVVIGFHFTDFLVHGWDVARSIGAAFEPPADLTAAALGLARRIPDTPQTRGPGAPFGREVDVPEGSDDFGRLLGVVGRSPHWKAGGAE